jgi:aquaporin Z
MNGSQALTTNPSSDGPPRCAGRLTVSQQHQAILAIETHWPEYLMEAAELGLFMVSACSFTVLLEHPASPVRLLVGSSFLRMVLIGVAMGLTLLGLIHTPWGKRSGAHINPSTTLMFLRLGKVETWDAIFYMCFQFIGALVGVMLSFAILGSVLRAPSVNFAVTQPGTAGAASAFIAELIISFVLALTVLSTSNDVQLSRFTPYFAATLVATYIMFEAPFSGMSMNPARTFGSALPAHAFNALWIYFTAPPIGMLLAAELYLRLRSAQGVYCAKYHHRNSMRCIFRCRYAELQRTRV